MLVSLRSNLRLQTVLEYLWPFLMNNKNKFKFLLEIFHLKGFLNRNSDNKIKMFKISHRQSMKTGQNQTLRTFFHDFFEGSVSSIVKFHQAVFI